MNIPSRKFSKQTEVGDRNVTVKMCVYYLTGLLWEDVCTEHGTSFTVVWLS